MAYSEDFIKAYPNISLQWLNSIENIKCREEEK